jgi:hypothetical protein
MKMQVYSRNHLLPERRERETKIVFVIQNDDDSDHARKND